MAVLNTNIYSLNTQRHLAKTELGLAQATERLASGKRINSAKDDAAGLAVAMQMEASSRVLMVNIRNMSDVISQTQIAESALGSVSDMLQRMNELDIQANSSSLSQQDRDSINLEFKALAESITKVQEQATMNGQTVFSGNIQPIATIAGDAGSSSVDIKNALEAVNLSRSEAGAKLNTLDFQIQSMQVNYENQQAAKSRIMDADYAQETANQAKYLIMQQAGIAMLAQANNLPQNILTLLR